jgi:hypothetical protein
MNRINVKRLLLSGFVTLVVFIILELFVEQVFGQMLFSNIVEEWYMKFALPSWGINNYLINFLIAVVNCTIILWLYAALRPMFGVGTKTALITSAFFLVFISSFAFNQVNIGAIPLKIAMIELLYQLVELPLALIAGAHYYEAV